jgi:hypothetical protein
VSNPLVLLRYRSWGVALDEYRRGLDKFAGLVGNAASVVFSGEAGESLLLYVGSAP